MTISEWKQHLLPLNWPRQPRAATPSAELAESLAREVVWQLRGNNPHHLRDFVARLLDELFRACHVLEGMAHEEEVAQGLWSASRRPADIAEAEAALLRPPDEPASQ